MKNHSIKPCHECPFRKNSLKGWLGGFTAEETYAAARSEAEFDCHLTRGEEQERKHCAGRLLHAKKTCKSFRNKELEQAKTEVIKNNSLDTILGFDFLEHHRLQNS